MYRRSKKKILWFYQIPSYLKKEYLLLNIPRKKLYLPNVVVYQNYCDNASWRMMNRSSILTIQKFLSHNFCRI